MSTIAIIPTYNEIDNLEGLVSELLEHVSSLHILIVDDASPDGTGELADELARADDRLSVLHRSGKLGLGTAYIEGFAIALARNYEYIVQMDADRSHRPIDLPLLLERAQDADVAIGSRNIPGGRTVGWSLFRRILSRGGSLYVQAILHMGLKDSTSGFRCFRSSSLDGIDLTRVRSTGYGFQVEMNYLWHLAGCRIVEAPIVFPNRTMGRSKMSLRIAMEAALLVWQLRREHGHQAVTRPTTTSLSIESAVRDATA